MDFEIKKCPFCGEAPIFRTTFSAKADMRCMSFNLGCIKCKIFLPKDYCYGVSLNQNGTICVLQDDRQEAVDTWNTRYQEKEN